jgi:hypothetical protein
MLKEKLRGKDLTMNYRKTPKFLAKKVLVGFPGLEAEPDMEPLIKIAELAEYFMRHKVLINKLDPVKHQAEIETIWASLKQNENESEY